MISIYRASDERHSGSESEAERVKKLQPRHAMMPESKIEKSSLEPLAAGPQHGDKASDARLCSKKRKSGIFKKSLIYMVLVSNSCLTALCRLLFPLHYAHHSDQVNLCDHIHEPVHCR
jgi:hypothetical protein